MMKHYNKSIKFIGKDEFFRLYEKFLYDSEKGYRMKKDGQRLRLKSLEGYRYTLRLLKLFCDETNFEIKVFLVNHLKQQELQRAKKHWMQFYRAFTDYLYEKGLFDNYVGQTIKNLRVVLNYLNNEQMIPVGYFHKQFHIPKEDIKIVVFSPAQLNYLIYNEAFIRELPYELRAIRDIFVFGCTVALRFSDLMELRPFHLSKIENDYYLRVISGKTSTETSIKLPGYAIEILEKYRGCQPTLLPVCSIGYFNLQLKKLTTYIVNSESMIKTRMQRGKPVIIFKNEKKKLHYTMADHISSHTMRRTAITTMLRLGMPEQAVRKISGHAANSKEFYKYVTIAQQYLDTETEKVFEKLAQYSSL